MKNFLAWCKRRSVLWWIAACFGIYVGAIALLNLVGAHDNLEDDAKFITAVAGAIGVFWGLRRLHQKVDTVVNQVNHVEEEQDPGGRETLGHVVKRIEEKVDTAIAESIVSQRMIVTGMEQQGNRITQIRTDLNRLLEKEQ